MEVASFTRKLLTSVFYLGTLGSVNDVGNGIGNWCLLNIYQCAMPCHSKTHRSLPVIMCSVSHTLSCMLGFSLCFGSLLTISCCKPFDCIKSILNLMHYFSI